MFDAYSPINSNDLLTFINRHKIPFLYSPPQHTPPLKESVFHTLALLICPTIKLLSMTNLLAIALIVLYSISLSTGIDVSVSILQVSPSSLLNFGANSPLPVYNGAVYRLFSAAFLCSNLPNLLNNLLVLYILLPRLETCVSYVCLSLVSILSIINGNLLQDLASSNPNQISAGASTFLFGYVGLLTAYLLVNWTPFEVLDVFRSQLACTTTIMNLFALLYAFYVSPAGIDYYGHLGGYIGGLFGGMLLLQSVDHKSTLTYKAVGGAVLFAHFLICFLVFYLAKY